VTQYYIVYEEDRKPALNLSFKTLKSVFTNVRFRKCKRDIKLC